MRFLLDENVPRSVATLLSARGHEVLLVVEVMQPGSDDRVVAAYAHQHQAIVITWNAVDFKRLISRRPVNNHNLFRLAGLICISCPEEDGSKRLARVIDVIEYEYERAKTQSDHRVIVDVGKDRISILR